MCSLIVKSSAFYFQKNLYTMKTLIISLLMLSSMSTLVKKDCLLQFQIDVARVQDVAVTDGVNCRGTLSPARCRTEVSVAS